ncbi:MAG: dihydropteroate synthase, partial [Deltaproteobacteria bacterium]|nr:dihydropteroate synthase [Deltaproteobacteria bacterium]
MNTNHPQTPDPALQQPVSPCALPIWRVGKWQWDFTRPLIMGILNLSPESFSDGREVLSGRVDRAVARGVELIGQGADILDIGGASSHPQAPAVDPLEEFRRVEPVIRELAALGLV